MAIEAVKLHPLIPLIIEVAISNLVVGFTPSSSILRPASLPVTAICLWVVIQNSMIYMVRSPWAGLVGGYAISFFFQYIDVALLSSYSFDDRGDLDCASSHRPKTPPSATFILQRLKFSFSTLINFRYINTPKQVKGVPRFSNRQLDYVPTRKRFLLNAILTSILSYVVLDLMTSTADPELTHLFFSRKNIPLFRRRSGISFLEFLMRIGATAGLGISMNCVQRGIYCIFGFFSVITGISEPKSWPPFYGSLIEAYSLRRFWSVVWHQTNTQKLLSISKFVLQDTLKLSRNSSVSRYLRVLVVFLISGLMHLLIDTASGIPMSESGAVQFFLTQVLGVFAEDLFVKGYRYLFVPKQRPAYLEERIIGHVWTLMFLSWSMPVYLYPILQRSGPEHSTIPFSIVGKLKSGKW